MPPCSAERGPGAPTSFAEAVAALAGAVNSLPGTLVGASISTGPTVLAPVATERSDSSVDSAHGSPKSQAARGQPKLGVLYWGGGLDGKGWDLNGRGAGGFPRICRTCNAVVDSWKGRMENVQVTLRICASEGPGFKRYIKHFMALSAQACVELRLHQYHQFNRVQKRKVLTERIVIGGILETYAGQAPAQSGMRVSNGGPHEGNWISYLRRRARRYRWQAHREGGHFAALLLEGGCVELQLRDLLAAGDSGGNATPARIKRLLVILGGPEGIGPDIRDAVRSQVELYTDFPVMSMALPGGLLHSYYALANILIFHDQGLLLPYLQARVGRPRAPPKVPRAAGEHWPSQVAIGRRGTAGTGKYAFMCGKPTQTTVHATTTAPLETKG